MELRTVLHLTRDMLGESGLSTTATVRAEFHFGLVLGDMETQFWQIVNLPSKMIGDIHLVPDSPTRAGSGER
ncbi:hypothetical protein Dcae01_03381 [Deinococcus caeni]|uniref:Uncharacterized protein n=1 Tax=Deinococcus caeni TaxID=569127 RepID=A0ABP9UGK0_9DEIO